MGPRSFSHWPSVTAVIATGLCGAFGAIIALAAAEAIHPARQLDMAGDRFLTRPIATGFYDPETSPDGMTYVWSADRVSLALRGLDRSGEWILAIRMRSAAVDSTTAVVALVDGVVVQRWPADGQLLTRQVVIPRSTRSGALVTLAAPGVDAGPADRRVLGLLIDGMTFTPERRFVRPPGRALRATASLGFGAGCALALARVPALFSAALIVFLGCIYAGLLSLGLTPFSPSYSVLTESLAVTMCIGAVATRLVIRTQGVISIEARMLVGIAMTAFATKALILMHPAVLVGDIGFHIHRLQSVRGGHWLFTSTGPGGEFPYPVALYWAAGVFHGLTRDRELVLRLLPLAADTLAGLLMYLAGSRMWGNRRAALLSAALFIVARAPFHTQAVAFLTNGFGESIATIALLSLMVAPVAPLGVATAISASAMLAAMLSHVSTAILLGISAAASAVAQVYRATPPMRRVAVVAALSVAISAAASYAIYYRHFNAIYAQHAAALLSSSPRPIPDNPQIPRVEAHQISWAPGAAALRARVSAVPRYLQRYFGWSALLLAAAGVANLLARRDPLSRVVLARGTVCAAFVLIGVATPLDLRYYLAGASAVALAGGLAAAEGMSSTHVVVSTSFRLLVAWCIIDGVFHWFRWFV